MGLVSQGRKERALSREESEGPGLELRRRSDQGAARQRRSEWPEWQNPAEEVGEEEGRWLPDRVEGGKGQVGLLGADAAAPADPLL